MPDKTAWEKTIREAAYRLWEHEGRPEGRAMDYWLEAREIHGEEEKVLDGRPDVNMPALLTKDVPGG